MKRILTVLAVVVLLAGCTKHVVYVETDPFAQAYETAGGISGRLDDAEDIKEKLTNGTHVVLFAHPDEDDKPIVQQLAKAVKDYGGMVIYYYDMEDVDSRLAGEIQDLMTPWISEGYFNEGKPVIYMIKDGELVDCIYSYSEGYIKSITDALYIMATNEKPACSGGC